MSGNERLNYRSRPTVRQRFESVTLEVIQDVIPIVAPFAFQLTNIVYPASGTWGATTATVAGSLGGAFCTHFLHDSAERVVGWLRKQKDQEFPRRQNESSSFARRTAVASLTGLAASVTAAAFVWAGDAVVKPIVPPVPALTQCDRPHAMPHVLGTLNGKPICVLKQT